ncbi:N-6 DNA methylase [Nocardia takedensis]|uniref:class I SAM-dependent DNA methyltransferase n=1 Tax=Nocardia takedensis TaxID=259390 RepID=UPI000310DFC3|nr:class I SAM-dependent DNA methyltransferase [Nocardia takedensis]
MRTGESRTRIDRLWDAFWTGGIANPLEVVDQLTYLMFLERLDRAEALPDTERPRWSRLRALPPEELLRTVREEVFPWLRGLGETGSPYGAHLRDARLTIPTAGLLARAVATLDELSLDGDAMGDLYEYMLARLATSGHNGQFRTPRHIIDLMVAMTAPGPQDTVCDPACGTAGFLIGAAEHLRRAHAADLRDPVRYGHFQRGMFHGFDFDSTMLRIAGMNMLTHGIEHADIRYRDSLAGAASQDAGRYSLILANPPFAGSLDLDAAAADLLAVVRTRRTELLFLALCLRLLAPGGRAAVIVPAGVLFGSTRAHRDLRRVLVEDHRLDAVVALPSGVFKPYAGVSTAILVFTKDERTEHVWFYDLAADGYGLDDRRTPLLPPEKTGVAVVLDADEHAANNLPDVLARWRGRDAEEGDRARTEQSFRVPKAEIAARDYDLSVGRYREARTERVAHRPPREIVAELRALEVRIGRELSDLERMLD